MFSARVILTLIVGDGVQELLVASVMVLVNLVLVWIVSKAKQTLGDALLLDFRHLETLRLRLESGSFNRHGLVAILDS